MSVSDAEMVEIIRDQERESIGLEAADRIADKVALALSRLPRGRSDRFNLALNVSLREGWRETHDGSTDEWDRVARAADPLLIATLDRLTAS